VGHPDLCGCDGIVRGVTFVFLVSCLSGPGGAGDTVTPFFVIHPSTRNTGSSPGRMNSVIMIFTQGGPQLGNLEAGLVATWIGAPLSVIAGGIATLILVAAVTWRVPQLRHYRD